MATNDLCTELSKDVKLDANMVRFSWSLLCVHAHQPSSLSDRAFPCRARSSLAFLLWPSLAASLRAVMS